MERLPVEPFQPTKLSIGGRGRTILPADIHRVLRVVPEKLKPERFVVINHAEKVIGGSPAPRRRLVIAAGIENPQHVVDQVVGIDQYLAIRIRRSIRLSTKQREVVGVAPGPVERLFEQFAEEVDRTVSDFGRLHPTHRLDDVKVCGITAKIGCPKSRLRTFLRHEKPPVHAVHVRVIVVALRVVMPADALQIATENIAEKRIPFAVLKRP